MGNLRQILTGILVTFICTVSFYPKSALTAPETVYPVYNLADHFLRSLKHFHQANEMMADIKRFATTGVIPEKEPANWATQLLASNRELSQAAQALIQYRDSKNDRVRTVFFSSMVVFRHQIKINNRYLALLEEYYGVGRSERKNLSAYRESFEKIQKEEDENLSLLVNSAVMISLMLRDGKVGEKGVVETLAITKPEKDALLFKMSDLFGKELTRPFKPGVNAAIGPAQVIEKALRSIS